ncbi:HNH endonuclease family protein [Bacteroides fragilis]|nr:HNH endonuclease family protein [Bacteroides fragilis]
MIQSALRVSYTSPKVMHWITELILWLFNNDDDQNPKLTDAAVSIAAQATQENFLNGGNYKLGVQTPHIVFNFLDYLLWKNDKKKYEDFEFEFRNSVEHWYPQNPSNGSFDSWNNKDTFGNLCIISRSVNSKFSNLSPESKMKSYEKMVKKGSLKLRIMGEIMQNSSNENWISTLYQKHEDDMISILKETYELVN